MAINNEAFFYKLVYVTSTYYTHRETPVNDVPSNYLCAILNSVFTSRIDVRLPFSACDSADYNAKVDLYSEKNVSFLFSSNKMQYSHECNIKMQFINRWHVILR